MSYGSTAALVRKSKEKHPEQFCSVPRCLWRIKSGDGRDLGPCRNHPRAGLLQPMGPIPGLPPELADAIAREKGGAA